MTFQEYKNQIDPTFQVKGSVVVTKSDCVETFIHNENQYIVLDFSYLNKDSGLQFSTHTYLVINGLCWTLDETGNMRSISVFKYEY
jgi:hypothetical protein